MDRNRWLCVKSEKAKLRKVVVCATVIGACTEAAAAAVHRNVRKCQRWGRAVEILKELEEKIAKPTWKLKLKLVVHAMNVEMHAGLASEGGSKLKMLITYVAKLPTGNEEGLYYALDLGGTNVRMLRVQLGDKDVGIISQEITEVSIPPNLMVGTSDELFDYIAAELGKFAAQRFSSVSWFGQYVVAELTKVIQRQGLDMCVTALVNDTVGTLAGGTGTNAAYVERVPAIQKWHGPLPDSGDMAINMEWGNFRSSHLPLTEYDCALDAESLNPSDQIFEKMTSGLYLGEIVRIVFQYKCEISDTSLEVRKVVVEICNIIATRGARLSAAGILGILKKLGKDTISEVVGQKNVIAMDGGLFEHYTEYTECLENTLKELVGEDISESIIIEHSNDGSGIGAALLITAK
uniref:Phosphotransferase n=1 Tax=Glycine max TaxID=3847 RepID=A0A0R0J250_SOYBN